MPSAPLPCHGRVGRSPQISAWGEGGGIASAWQGLALDVVLVDPSCELYVSFSVVWATLVFLYFAVHSGIWICPTFCRADSRLDSPNMIFFQFHHDHFQVVIEYFVEFRLYHELAKGVQSADKIFELLYLKNFVDS